MDGQVTISLERFKELEGFEETFYNLLSNKKETIIVLVGDPHGRFKKYHILNPKDETVGPLQELKKQNEELVCMIRKFKDSELNLCKQLDATRMTPLPFFGKGRKVKDIVS